MGMKAPQPLGGKNVAMHKPPIAINRSLVEPGASQASFGGEGQTPSCSLARLESYEAISAKHT